MLPKKIGIIPDGNRRCGRSRGVGHSGGYLAGSEVFLEVVDWCLQEGVTHLATFVSTKLNVQNRPIEEIRVLHTAALSVCEAATAKGGIELTFYGKLQEIPEAGARNEILAFKECYPKQPRLAIAVGFNCNGERAAGMPDLEMVIRTGGHHRLSGFLPLQSAQAELYFTPVLWPDFTRQDWDKAMAWYEKQDRNFGE